ncbi:hypothetical protein EMIT0P291_30155 [Pseudomonas sp. IT-P291]
MAPSKSLHRLCIRWKNAGGSKRTTAPCGSELARDSGLTFNENVECWALIASKLAPTEFSASWKVAFQAKKAPKGAFRLSASGKPALPSVTRRTQSDNVRLSIAAGMLGPQLHGRLL